MEIEIKNPSEAEKAALAAEYEKALAFSADESAEYSLSHYKKMCRIIGCRLKPSAGIRKKKTRLAALLIAAAVLLALVGCTAVVYREQIGEFFTEIFEDHIKGSFAEGNVENNMIIDEYYSLTYVPEGYELVKEYIHPSFAKYIFKNSAGSNLIFEQSPINSGRFYLDNESEFTDIIECGEYTVYYHRIERTYRCIWENEKYAFALYFDNEMSKEDIVKIIGETNHQ